jgi:hypothetical protein
MGAREFIKNLRVQAGFGVFPACVSGDIATFMRRVSFMQGRAQEFGRFRGAVCALLASLVCCVCCPWASAQVAYDKPLARVVRNADGTRLSTKVDPYNQVVEEVFFDAKGGVVWKLVRELDEALQPLKATKYDGSNRVLSRHRYLCVKGRVEEEEVLDPKEALVGRLVFYYDSKGRMSRIEQFDASGVLLSTARATVGRGVDPVVREAPGQTAPNPRGTSKTQPR